ncbi:MAG: threonine--tRNA ligase, partial [bacterium]|nr:threonine--tRNA ligase [bacterium]
FVDLCRGPHIKSTSLAGAFKLTKVSGAYWRGDEKNPQMQRIYGVAFTGDKELKSYFIRLNQAEKRDHRKLGQELGLFIHSELVGAGLPLFTEKGTAVINQMLQNMRDLNTKNGFMEVRTGYITRDELYKVSGHIGKFDDDLFHIETKEDKLVLKPMNCPHHTQLFARSTRSYRDLPIRYAEFSTLHRNEIKGVLGGLTRVRALTQDDAHSFVREDQVESEIEHILGTVDEVLAQYGLKYYVWLSVRGKDDPKAYLGDDKIWVKAEGILKKLVKKFKLKYETKEGEAAFYGPKIDFIAQDVIGREWQVSTIQLDFNMPQRFDLEYISEDGSAKRPVLIHRALNGTFERMLGILIEHYAGAFPVWLAPQQVKILPISEKFTKYANKVASELKANNIRVEVDDSNESLGKKIRNGELIKVPYLLVVGEKEQKVNKVSVRSHKNGDEGSVGLPDFISRIKKEVENKA